jgi:hypothetical protein
MEISGRAVVMAGIATVAASAVAIAPSVQPLPPPERTVQLTAAVQPLAQQENLLSILLTDPVRLLGPAVTPGTITPPPAPEAISIAPNLADTIDNVYLGVEPWVRWGFQVATDVLGWVPWVGWLSGQIMVFYNFFEGMVQSGVFNFTDWLRGQGGVVENLVDFGVDVFWSFVYLGIDEWNYFLPPLPPLPFPIPPRPPLNQFAAAGTLADATATLAVADAIDSGDVPAPARGALKHLEAPAEVGAGEDAQDGTRVAKSEAAAERKVARDVERAQGDVVARGASRTATGVAEADGDADSTGEAVAKGPRTSAQGGQDSVRKGAEGVSNSVDDGPKTVRAPKSSNADKDTEKE